MKRLIFALLAVLLLTSYLPAQGVVGVKSYSLGTISNSVDESYISETFSGLIKQFGCNKIDSMTISITVANETDIDSLDWYPVNWTTGGTMVKGSVKTHTVTLNVAAAATGTEVLLVSGTGVLAASFRGYEGFAFMTRGATAGNDPTDPNSVKVTIMFYGS